MALSVSRPIAHLHTRRPPARARSDNMAIGRLDATATTLSWSLLRAPDGAVLDTYVISK